MRMAPQPPVTHPTAVVGHLLSRADFQRQVTEGLLRGRYAAELLRVYIDAATKPIPGSG